MNRSFTWFRGWLIGVALFPVVVFAKGSESFTSEQRLEVSRRVHALILQKQKGGLSELKDYTEFVATAQGAKFEMLSVKGGEFFLGSPKSEIGHQLAEEPQKKVKIEPFWMGEVEVTWELYNAFYQNGKPRNSDGSLVSTSQKEGLAAIVCQPTPQYHDMFLNSSFANDPKHPAMDMTQHAANKFCQWLSVQTGHYYCLPTEAEWEYACRAGSATAWSFGDDSEELDDYAWYESNSNFTYQKVALKKPNAWGFYDMHGNVAEWVLDQYSHTFYQKIKEGEVNPWNRALTRYPRSIRGGSWDSPALETRSAARMGSSKDLKALDPQVPKSVWYHTGGQHIGFRVVRPVKTPSAEEMNRVWYSDWWSPERNSEFL